MPKRERSDSNASETYSLIDVVIEEREFNKDDQEKLLINEHERFPKSSPKVAHVLLETTDKETIAKQYAPPYDDQLSETTIRPVEKIEKFVKEFGPLGKVFVRAQTPGGTEMMGKRMLPMLTIDEEGKRTEQELWRLSPKSCGVWAKTGEYWWGVGQEDIPLHAENLSKEIKKDLEAELKDIEPEVKHIVWEPNSESILERAIHANKSRKPDQNTIMKNSSHEELEAFHEEHKAELHPKRKAILQKNKDAKEHYRGGGIKTQHRGEWLHLQGHSLAPLHIEPQHEGNLASGPKWLNSQMMTDGERTMKWMGLHRPKAKLKAECKFELIPGTRIIEKGHSKFQFKEAGRTVVLHQTLKPWVQYESLPKPSDVAQTTLVASKLLLNKKPSSIQKVTVDKGVHKMPKRTASPISADLTPEVLIDKKQLEEYKESKKRREEKAEKRSSAFKRVKASSPDLLEEPEFRVNKQDPYNNSIVKVFTRSFVPEYGEPWSVASMGQCSGSGFVFAYEGKKYIMTNAHVVENHVDVRVRLAYENDDFKARVIKYGKCPQADLAILRVSDKKFLHKAKAVKIGDMVERQQNVEVLGFPVGGEGLSFTSGPISRIELGRYEESGEHNLQAQLQAPINPGNSGGPVRDEDGKLVGVAFQTLLGGDGLHYLIPTPVIKHVIEHVFNPKLEKGFPSLEISLQQLVSPYLREKYGMKEGQTGVLIKKIDPLSGAIGLLKVDDIITEIDGIKVSNDEQVNVPGIGDHIDLNWLFLRKYIGETVSIKVLRKNPESKELEKVVVDVPLKFRAGETKKIGPIEYDKRPTHYFNSGVLFQPLTPNYIDDGGGPEFKHMRDGTQSWITEMPCTVPGEQIILINQIFKCDQTVGYDEIANQIIKKINGKEIKNMKDVIDAMENNPESTHTIEPANGELIVIKKMKPKEHMKMMATYGITLDRSADLMSPEQAKLYAFNDSDNEESDVESAADTIGEDDEEDAKSESVHSHEESEVESEEEETRKTEMKGFIEESEDEESEHSEEEQAAPVKHTRKRPRSETIHRRREESESPPPARGSKGTILFSAKVRELEERARQKAELKAKHKKIVMSDSESEEEELDRHEHKRHKLR
jgi:S1-C subfamily serine protease